MFRTQAAQGTAFGLEAKRYMDAGELVPDEIVVGVIEECLAPGGPLGDGFVLDGFPRTLHQAEELDRVLDGRPLDLAINLDVPREIVLDRIAGRRVCENCQRVYHVNMPPDERLDLRHVRRTVVQRDDDTEEAIDRRLELYEQRDRADHRLLPRRVGLLTEVDGVGDGDDVFERLVKVVDEQLVASGPAGWSCARRRTRSRSMRRAGRSSRRCTRRARAPPSRARRPPTSTPPPATCSTGGAPARTSSATTGSRPWSCISPNEVIVHGIPGDRGARRRRHRLDRLRGDHRGLARRRRDHGPGGRGRRRVAAVASTSPGPRSTPRSRRPSRATASATSAPPSRAVVDAAGFAVVREYVGHGIGTAMHEDPEVPNYGPAGPRPAAARGHGARHRADGQRGRADDRLLDDGWTVVTADGSRSAHFEHTIAVTDDGPEVLTVP